jgi:flagellar basal body rod protein FlgC
MTAGFKSESPAGFVGIRKTADLQAATRAYEANLKVISTLGELEKKTVELLRSDA